MGGMVGCARRVTHEWDGVICKEGHPWVEWWVVQGGSPMSGMVGCARRATHEWDGGLCKEGHP